MQLSGKRRDTDEKVYLSEDRFGRPIEVHKRMAEIIADLGLSEKASVLDVGCATGEFIHYLNSRFPMFTYTGIDISEKMIAAAKPMTPSASFEVGSILEEASFRDRQFDLVLCSGTVQIFDDPSVPLRNLLAATGGGGVLMMHTLANADPVDLITRYRHADDDPDKWGLGWNIFSIRTFEKICAEFDPDIEMKWIPFHMPFALEKKDDPMRAYTIKTEHNPHQLIIGAGLMVNTQILIARRRC